MCLGSLSIKIFIVNKFRFWYIFSRSFADAGFKTCTSGFRPASTTKEHGMNKGKFIVIEGIYGSSKVIVRLVSKLREALIRKGNDVYEIDSPDSGRAQLMGAQDLDGSWRYGVFVADFFFELASRARACTAIRQELEGGRIVLC